ncbi:perilipin-1 isoform X1 [Latimeria chalumnae]|uniref:Perilipin 1 n=1 Tax=Latimeria chalumnae TaxID=7897 RepID=H3BFF0_LATCH|nr:PREDICTED: perilipin-1 isoform X1 [Latimeria chalumnae]|eukprot:XP_005989838.1 PREDICTED: perilipin-1 isoform X1 [Latimeria chalumnae]
MAVESSAPSQGDSAKGKLIKRLFDLPVVNYTYEAVQNTYVRTKQVHPLVEMVCDMYERGAKGSASLAVWSAQPILQRLEPQITAADNIACIGLDHLEDKIPALHYSPEKIASELKETVTSAVEVARSSITSPILSTSSRAVSTVASGYERAQSTASGMLGYLLDTTPARLATRGVDTALTTTEKLMDYFLPISKEEKEAAKDHSETGESDIASPGSEPNSFRRLTSLASTFWQRTSRQAVTAVQHGKSRGQELAAMIPGVTLVSGIANKSLETGRGLVESVQSSVSSWVQALQSAPSPKEKRKKTDGDVTETPEALGMVRGLGERLQNTYVSAVSGIKNAPSAIWNMAGELRSMTPGQALSLTSEKVYALGGNVRGVTGSVLRSISQYIAIPGTSVGEEEEEDVCGPGTESESPPAPQRERGEEKPIRPSPKGSQQVPQEEQLHALSFLETEDTRLLHQKVLQQIPIQQRALRGGPVFKAEESTTRKAPATSPAKETAVRRSEIPSSKTLNPRAAYGSSQSSVKKE